MKQGSGGSLTLRTPLSVPSTRAYAMKRFSVFSTRRYITLSVPSTRAYAMKLMRELEPQPPGNFQYPQLGPTR